MGSTSGGVAARSPSQVVSYMPGQACSRDSLVDQVMWRPCCGGGLFGDAASISQEVEVECELDCSDRVLVAEFALRHAVKREACAPVQSRSLGSFSI